MASERGDDRVPQASEATIPEFVAPSSYLRHPGRDTHAGAADVPRTQLETEGDKEQRNALKSMRSFLKIRTSYDVLPLSYRLIILDSSLTIKASLGVMMQMGIVSAPMWDSKTSTFAGLITANDYINVIQYYWQNPDKVGEIDKMRLRSLPDIERAIGVAPVETISIHPSRPLYEALTRMLSSRARRIPLVDLDDETQRPMVVSVITQYRILKFISTNVKDTQKLRKSLAELENVGTYSGIQTASMDTPVIDVIHLLVKYNISSVPIVDETNYLQNVFEAVDVITIIQGGGDYENLTLTVGEALLKRSEDFAGCHTCSLSDRLSALFDTIRRSRVHRFTVVNEDGFLMGVLTLSDILKYVLLEGESDAEP